MKLINYVKKIKPAYYDCNDEIVITSFKDYPELKSMVESFLIESKNKIIANRCHVISMLIAKAYPDQIDYIEGYASTRWLDTKIIIPVQHAWNKWNGLYFDLSAELVIKSYYDEYVELVCADLNEVSNDEKHPLLNDEMLFGYHLLNRLKL